MEQFRQIGEVLGSLRAQMVFRDEIELNRCQCRLLVDALNLAFDGISDELRTHLRFREKNSKWKPLESPLADLHRVYQDAEHFVKQMMDPKPWWGHALALKQNTDCVELHLHNLLWCIPVVLEAIENISEATGIDEEETHKKRLFVSKKYEREWMEPKLFQHKLGKLYLASQELSARFDTAWKEDQWILSELAAVKMSSALTEQEKGLAELIHSPKGTLFPSSILVQSPDYQVKRKIGGVDNYKEIQWMDESFSMKHVIGNVESSMQEISLASSVHHPNIVNYMYSFANEEKNECFMVMELMSKDLSTYIKDNCSSKKKAPFPLFVAVDTMLQIARGMEFLHSKKIFHGDLNPSNILVKSRNSSQEGYLHVKVTGFGLSPEKSSKYYLKQVGDQTDPCIWYAPEVLVEQEETGDGSSNMKCTERADVYSFAMICFELLTGKVPFEDEHLQGDKMSKNIRAGTRPLFSSQSPKYMTNLTKRCWHSDPFQRPSFSSICRVLRYIKRFLILNPEHGQSELPMPPVDYFDLDAILSKSHANWWRNGVLRASDVPLQMYAYRVLEREKTNANVKDVSSDWGIDGAFVFGEENACNGVVADDAVSVSLISIKSAPQINHDSSKKSSASKFHGRLKKQLFGLRHAGQTKGTKTVRPQDLTRGRSFSMNADSRRLQKAVMMNTGRRRRSGHVSDSELA